MRLYLVRHASTQGNEQHRYVGRRIDEPLSARGRAECLRAGSLLQVREVYVSPLRRARETAELCFPHATLRVVEGLEEFDFGAFEGRSADEMADDETYRRWVEGWCMDACPGGESRADFVARSNAALTSLLHAARARDVGQLVVVAHGGTIMAALSELAGASADGDPYFGWHVGPCEGYVAEVHERAGAISLESPIRFSLQELCGPSSEKCCL